jgi:hypothetical protein
MFASNPSTALTGESLETVIATAVRAPSVHNTQPWRFRVVGSTIELYADRSRRLDVADPTGREMVISCGAALFGLRLAVRQAGFRPLVDVLPVWPGLDPLARVHLGPPAASGPGERQLLDAVWLRHTHRCAFACEPLPGGLLATLRRDAAAESVAFVDAAGHQIDQLRRFAAAAKQGLDDDPAFAAEVVRWTPRGYARDGVPARAYPSRLDAVASRLPQRDFDHGRGGGTLPVGGGPPAATVVLATAADGPLDWLQAGQALHRVLLRAASVWVFASLHTQPLESPSIRGALRSGLRTVGAPQMLMELGRWHTAPLTARRPAAEVIDR